MNYELDGVCIHCARATPTSENTLRPEGIVCSFCRETKPSAHELHTYRLERLHELELERARLVAALAREPRLVTHDRVHVLVPNSAPLLN